MTKKYNGWANYETWAVNLWLSNDQGSYLTVRELCQEEEEEYEGSQKLKEYVEEETENLIEKFTENTFGGIISDIFHANLSLVDWAEIWKAFREE